MSQRVYISRLGASPGFVGAGRSRAISQRAYGCGRSNRSALVGGAHPAGWLIALLLIALVLTGCSAPRVDETYGRRRSEGAGSVNGTSILADMFVQRDCRVVGAQELSPKIYRSDCIVWFPNDFAAPTTEQRDYLENWLAEGEKTLVYVGRDFNAAPHYWQHAAQNAPADQVEELLRRGALSRSKHDSRRTELADNYDAEWFTINTGDPQRKVEQLAGPWSKNLAPKQTEIYRQATLTPPPAPTGDQFSWDAPPMTEVLLSANGDPLIFRLTSGSWYGSQILVVVNGSMVLNMPLVNKENRKIAGKLIDQCLPAEQVVFLESQEGGPPVFGAEPPEKLRTGWEAFTIYPLGIILMHLAVTGVLFCFAWFAIFGRPRKIPVNRLSNFGHHIAALGKLLEHTGDAEYARSRLRHYNQTARRDSGASHIKPKK